MHGIVDEKTDVFAFGVLLLELITGRRALDYSQQSLVMWVCLLLPSIYIPWKSSISYYFLKFTHIGKTTAEEEQN